MEPEGKSEGEETTAGMVVEGKIQDLSSLQSFFYSIKDIGA